MRLKDRLTRARRARLTASGAAVALALGAIVATAEGDVPFFGSGGAQLYPNNLLIARSTYAEPSLTASSTGVTGTLLPPDCTSSCGYANTDRDLPAGVQQRRCRRLLRHHLADLPRPGGSEQRALDQHAHRADERCRDELLLEVGARAQPLDERQVRVVHGLRRHAGDARRLEREHAGRGGHGRKQQRRRSLVSRGRDARWAGQLQRDPDERLHG